MNPSDALSQRSTNADSELLDRILGHDVWTMREFLAICEQLSEESLDTDFDIGHRTVRKTLDHMIWNVECWTCLMSHGVVPDRSGDTSIAGLQQRHRTAAESFESVSRAAVKSGRLNDEYVDPVDGLQKSIGSTILHIVSHNMHHRAQLLFMLRRLGVSNLPEGDVLTWEQQTKEQNL